MLCFLNLIHVAYGMVTRGLYLRCEKKNYQIRRTISYHSDEIPDGLTGTAINSRKTKLLNSYLLSFTIISFKKMILAEIIEFF